jgi:hypothetical protein
MIVNINELQCMLGRAPPSSVINPDVSKIEIPTILNYILPQYLTATDQYLPIQHIN